MDITDLLAHMHRSKASDLHLSSNNPPVMRINGDMIPLSHCPDLSPEEIKEMVYSIMTDHQRSEYEGQLEIDFSISFGQASRFRVNAFNTMNGPAAVFRCIPTRILSLEELGAPEVFYKLTNLHKGLLLVTGPTGSGKSTTLAALLNHINVNQAKHIITIEDPIEFVHQSKRSLINQREVGASTKSFARALKSCLREDPDIILVGELRDIETIHLAMTAAETGHLVLGTLHTNTAPKTIDRIIDVFPSADKEMARAMLSVSLEAVISQTLVKTKDGQGRIAAHEVMLGTPAVRNLIRESKIPQLTSVIQTSTKLGMQTMKDSLAALVTAGMIDEDEMQRVMVSSNDMEKKEPATTNNAAGSMQSRNLSSF
jgi:twitching motility protein PilT